MPVKASFQLYGDSGDGKTAQVGEFAKWLFKTTGGKIDPKTERVVGGKRTRLYSADSGGWSTVQPLVDVGIVEVVPLVTLPNPFSWVNKITLGMVPKVVGGKIAWVKDLEGIGCVAFEGETAFSDRMMQAMADMAAAGINIGGDGAFNFMDGDLKVGSNNRGHYMQAQSALSRAISQSQWMLPDDMFVIWTAMARRGEDDNQSQVLGPQAAGKALTNDLPRWFVYTFRLAAEPVQGKGVVHRLYMEDHKDRDLKGAKGLGNARVPMMMNEAKVKIPEFIEPASLVKAYEVVLAASAEAKKALIEECK
jgi:hypothetical protein